MSSPVSVEYTPIDIVTEIIIFEIWSPVKQMLNSWEIDSKRGNIMHKEIPYKMEQR